MFPSQPRELLHELRKYHHFLKTKNVSFSELNKQHGSGAALVINPEI
jgi:hypothetical protein